MFFSNLFFLADLFPIVRSIVWIKCASSKIRIWNGDMGPRFHCFQHVHRRVGSRMHFDLHPHPPTRPCPTRFDLICSSLLRCLRTTALIYSAGSFILQRVQPSGCVSAPVGWGCFRSKRTLMCFWCALPFVRQWCLSIFLFPSFCRLALS